MSGAGEVYEAIDMTRLFDVMKEDFRRFCTDNGGSFVPGILIADIRENADAIGSIRLDRLSDGDLEMACRMVMSSIAMVTVMMAIRNSQQRKKAMH